jgi:N-acetyltransferase 10
MLVLQDFAAVTPNLLARTFETVAGGGVILLLLESIEKIEELPRIPMAFHKRVRADAFGAVSGRFNARFLALLKTCGNFLALNDRLEILGQILERPMVKAVGSGEDELESIKEMQRGIEFIGSIVEQIVTVDQAQAVLYLINLLDKFEMNRIVGLTAARGRGKSAALGLALAYASARGYSNIFVTAPSPSNVSTVFEFVLRGFDSFGYRDKTDYTIFMNDKKEVTQIALRKKHRQAISYIPPGEAFRLNQCEVLAIDEAAAIPLPVVRKLLGPYIVIVSSTVHGYEGTGRSLSLKLFAEFKKSKGDQFAELQMAAPIRYSADDPVEDWLSRLLCLTVEPPDPESFPPPNQCQLLAINRDLLFSGVPVTEYLLSSVVALSVASHYKNEPDDLLLMSDAPNHRVFALLPPILPNQRKLGGVLCYVQAALEGQIPRTEAVDALNRGHRPDGDLIPWTVARQFADYDFPTRTGIRIVRVAVHPAMQGKGYGTVAIQQLIDFYGHPPDPGMVTPDAPLLKRLPACDHEVVDYAGVSFGLTTELFRFWQRSEFRPVYIAPSANSATGEHSAIVLRSFIQDADRIDDYCRKFKLRFGRILPLEFGDFTPKLCDAIFASLEEPVRERVDGRDFFDARDLHRIQLFIRKQIKFSVVHDLVPRMCEFFFETNASVKLTRLMRTLLIVLGYQQRSVADCSAMMQIEENQVYSQLERLFGAFLEYLTDGEDTTEFTRTKSSVVVE